LLDEVEATSARHEVAAATASWRSVYPETETQQREAKQRQKGPLMNAPASKQVVALVALTACCSCDLFVSPSVLGDWFGRLAPLHTTYLEIRFTEENGRLTGVACQRDGSRLSFTDAQVIVGTRGRVTVLIPNSERTLSGRFQDGVLKLQASWNQSVHADLMRGGDYCGQAQ
jgi:hypothetical protein